MPKPPARPPRSPKCKGTGKPPLPIWSYVLRVVATALVLGALYVLWKNVKPKVEDDLPPPESGPETVEKPQVTFNWWEDRGVARSKIYMRNTSDIPVTGARLVSDTPGWEWRLPKDGSGRTLKPGQIYWDGWYPKKPKGAEPSVRFICDQQ